MKRMQPRELKNALRRLQKNGRSERPKMGRINAEKINGIKTVKHNLYTKKDARNMKSNYFKI